MPIVMLKGVREKRIRKFKEQKERTREENLHYNPDEKVFDVDFMYKKLKEKSQENLNTEDKHYKYKDAAQTKRGKFTGGVLSFSKNSIKAIEGRQ